MKAFTLACFALSATIASAHEFEPSAPNLALPSLRGHESNAPAFEPRLGSAATDMALQSAEKKGQVWLLLSYEHFSGENAGDEFGFTPTSFLGYQRNFYPSGRLKNAIGYALGIGVFNAGAAVFYHQGSANRVDFRAGVGLNVFYLGSVFGGSVLLPTAFVGWGVKI